MNKRFAFVLVLVLASSSLIVVGSVSGVAKPSVPEFTVKAFDHSYDVPPTYSTDPYTGKTTMTEAGYRAQNGTIELTIKNQPFTPHGDGNGHFIALYYRISSKKHFEDSWSYVYPNFNHGYTDYMPASDSYYTVMSFEYGENKSGYPGEIPAGGQIDFQVEAFAGYSTTVEAPSGPFWLAYSYQVFTGETSGWSNTQTITIPTNALSPFILGVAITAIVVACAGLLLLYKKRRQETRQI